MAGYREHSFDPNAYQELGRPMRPYNWVQWTGVALVIVSLAINLAYLGRDLGWMPFAVGSPSFAFVPLIIGITLVNSRREPSTLVGSEQLQRNRRMLLITVVACAIIFGIAAIIEFTRS